jgi:hypothetical protein
MLRIREVKAEYQGAEIDLINVSETISGTSEFRNEIGIGEPFRLGARV